MPSLFEANCPQTSCQVPLQVVRSSLSYKVLPIINYVNLLVNKTYLDFWQFCSFNNLRKNCKLESICKPYSSQHPKGIIQEGLHWLKWCSTDTIAQIIDTFTSKVFNLFLVNVVEERIKSQITSHCIFLRCAHLNRRHS